MDDRLGRGSDFGPYTIEGFIARGGMGQVYAARHAVYGSSVALKVLHENFMTDDDWRARFNEEAVVGQRLKHPMVVSARELVQHDGRVAFVMDLVQGAQTMKMVMDREYPTGLPAVRGLAVFLQVIQGVEYAHAKGVVHGDLKPGNVLVAGEPRKPETWLPRVTDFGTVGLIAHPVMFGGRAAVVATPRYASPEHVLGVDAIEVRSDIYCLGLLLHYLLSGQHASTARTVQGACVRLLEPVPELALVDLPDGVIRIFRRCCEVDPGLRYPSCMELALDVRSMLDDLGGGVELEDDLEADLATELMEPEGPELEIRDGGPAEEIELGSQSDISFVPGGLMEEKAVWERETDIDDRGITDRVASVIDRQLGGADVLGERFEAEIASLDEPPRRPPRPTEARSGLVVPGIGTSTPAWRNGLVLGAAAGLLGFALFSLFWM